MLRIRYRRIGRKNQPSYRVVVTDRANPPQGGNSVEEIGFYNPLTKEKNVNAERALFWLQRGAQPSASVHNLLVSTGVLKTAKVATHAKSKKEPTPAAQAAPAVSETMPAAASETKSVAGETK